MCVCVSMPMYCGLYVSVVLFFVVAVTSIINKNVLTMFNNNNVVCLLY